MSEILKVDQVSKIYKSGSRELKVLDQINFNITAGEIVSIVGPSGSGKTTLLGLCAGLDNTSEGNVTLCGSNINQLSENERALVRNENVMIPLELQGKSGARKVALDLLDRVGLSERAGHYPTQLSGGEQQRVSMARAFSNAPKILFADEPTGNLDETTGIKIESLLFDINKEQKTTLVIVTHDLDLAAKTDRIIRLRGGKVESDVMTSLAQKH